jgi:hypothetical protein
MKCQKCSAELKPNAKFCTGCGGKIGGAEEQKQPPKQKAKEVAKINVAQLKEKLTKEIKEEQKQEAEQKAKEVEKRKEEKEKLTTEIKEEQKQEAEQKAKEDGRHIQGYYNWILNGQEICRRVSYAEIRNLSNAKGIIVGPGTKAVFFTKDNDKSVYEMPMGTYDFPKGILTAGEKKERNSLEKAIKSDKDRESRDKEASIGIWKTMRNWADNSIHAVSQLFTKTEKLAQKEKDYQEYNKQKETTINEAKDNRLKEKKDKSNRKEDELKELLNGKFELFTIYLVREKNIGLDFEFENIQMKETRTNIGLSLRLKLSNPILFMADYMIDTLDGMRVSDLSNVLTRHINAVLNISLKGIGVQDLENNPEVNLRLKEDLSNMLSEQHGSLEIIDIPSLTNNDDRIRELLDARDANYIGEQKLNQIIARNQLTNLVTTTGNKQLIQEAIIDLENETGLWSNEKNRLVLEEEKKRFMLLLEKEEVLMNAKTQDEIESAKAELLKTGLLREQDVNLLTRKIHEEHEDHELVRSQMNKMIQLEQLIEHGSLEQDYDIDKRRKELEAQLDMSDMEIELDTKKSDAKRDERRKDLDLDKEEMSGQLDLAAKAQKLTEEKRTKEHERKIEEQKEKDAAELQKIQMYKGMSVEEILVTNPDLTLHGAEAIAVKFKAEAEAKENDTRVEDAQRQTQEQRDFMETQQKNLVDIVKSVTGGAKSNEEPSLGNSSSSAPPNHTFCGSCGTPQPKTKKFCADCGSDL